MTIIFDDNGGKICVMGMLTCVALHSDASVLKIRGIIVRVSVYMSQALLAQLLNS